MAQRGHHGPHILVTCVDESSPPCRRVSDTSRLRCGRPLSYWSSIAGHLCGCPPGICRCAVFFHSSMSILGAIVSIKLTLEGLLAVSLVIIWSPSGGSFRFPVFLVCIDMVACFSAGGILFQLSGTLCEKKFFLITRRGVGIRSFSRSTWTRCILSCRIRIQV
jgi:hypothetical protein